MILSDRDIKKWLKEGKIKIKPKPNLKEQLGPCSLDLRLGNVFKCFKHNKCPFVDINSHIPIGEIMDEIRVKKGEPLIIQPGDFILAVTLEEFELPSDIMARLDGRSSLGRLGVVVHSTAARFDPGWKGKAVMELGNLGRLPVTLYPGMRICALTFETLSSPCEVPYVRHRDHKYAYQKEPEPSKIHIEKKIK